MKYFLFLNFLYRAVKSSFQTLWLHAQFFAYGSLVVYALSSLDFSINMSGSWTMTNALTLTVASVLFVILFISLLCELLEVVKSENKSGLRFMSSSMTLCSLKRSLSFVGYFITFNALLGLAIYSLLAFSQSLSQFSNMTVSEYVLYHPNVKLQILGFCLVGFYVTLTIPLFILSLLNIIDNQSTPLNSLERALETMSKVGLPFLCGYLIFFLGLPGLFFDGGVFVLLMPRFQQVMFAILASMCLVAFMFRVNGNYIETKIFFPQMSDFMERVLFVEGQFSLLRGFLYILGLYLISLLVSPYLSQAFLPLTSYIDPRLVAETIRAVFFFFGLCYFYQIDKSGLFEKHFGYKIGDTITPPKSAS